MLSLLLLWLSIFKAIMQQTTLNKDKIIYRNIEYPKNGYNFTIGMLTELTYALLPNPGGIYHMFGTVCTLYQYNNGEGPINITGSFNLQGINTESEAVKTYYEAMQLLKTNLYTLNPEDEKALKTRFPAPMGALIGASTFSEFLSVAPYFSGFVIPTISYNALPTYYPAGSASDDTLNPISKSVFSINPSSSPMLFTTINDFLLQMNWTLVGAIFEASIFGGLGVAYTEKGDRNGVNYVCSLIFAGDYDALSTVEKVVERFHNCAKNYRTVSVAVLWMSFTSAMRIINQFHASGYDMYTFIIAYKQDATFDPLFVNEDLLQYNFYFDTALILPNEQEVTTCIDRLITDNARTESLALFFLAEYFRIYYKCELYSKDVKLEVCKTERGDTDGKCLCAVFDSLKVDNQTYRYSFAADGVSTLVYAIDLLVNNCSRLNEIKRRQKDFCAGDTFTLEDLSEAISKVEFEGFTGPISFFQDSLLRKTAVYNVRQYNETGSGQLVGTSRTQGNGLVLNFTAMQFKNNQKPVSEIVPQIPDLSDGLVVAMFALFIAELVLALGILLWVFWNRNHKVLKRKSPLFLSFILLGIVLILTGAIIMSIGLKSSFMCIFYDFLLVLGLTLIVSCLMAKNWRIYRIFNNAQARAIYISDRNLLLFPAVLILVSLALLFTYCFASGVLELRRVKGFQNPFYIFDICASTTDWFQIFFIILFYFYFFVLFALTAMLALFTRHAHNHFRESNSIARIIYIYFCMGIIFIPLYYVQGDATNSQDTRFAIVSISVLILMLATMAILFLPEIQAVRRFEKKNRRREE